MVDRVRPLCLEQPKTGGSQLDVTPTEVDPTQDGVDARAFFAQNGTSADSLAYLSRFGSDLTLTDANAGTKNAQDLVSRVLGAVAAHQSLADPIHFLPEGPGDGWASGSYCQTVYNGALPISRVWLTSSAANAAKIVALAWTYKASTPLVATKTWTIYNTAGTAVRQIVDTISYSGILPTSTVRTWS